MGFPPSPARNSRFQNPNRLECFNNIEWVHPVKTWTVHGHGLSMAMDCPWPWTVHGHGLSMAMDCPLPSVLVTIALLIERKKLAPEARKQTIASESLKIM